MYWTHCLGSTAGTDKENGQQLILPVGFSQIHNIGNNVNIARLYIYTHNLIKGQTQTIVGYHIERYPI